MTVDVTPHERGSGPTYPQAGSGHKRGPARLEPSAAILGHLPRDSWRVLHDVRWPGRDGQLVDHVVIGPGGIFVIDLRHWDGPVVLDDGILRVESRPREREVAEAADAAADVAAVLEGVDPRWVVPVLCLVREDEVAGVTRGVVYCATGLLGQMLTARREVISVDRARFIAQLLQIKLVRGPSPEPDPSSAPDPSARRPVAPAPARARRRHRLPVELAPILLRSIVIGLGIAVLVGDPDLLNRAAQLISSLLTVT